MYMKLALQEKRFIECHQTWLEVFWHSNFLKQMIDKKRAIKYCKDDISLIENYDKAIADDTQTWECHHRRETIYSRSGLKEIGEYYNRPACELIFLTPANHRRLHHNGNSNPMFGKHHSEEAKKKMSESKKGKHWYNNGVASVQTETCPEGFVPGRIVCNKRA